jgi:RimJ/RimL family protein N-acetyltransferase
MDAINDKIRLRDVRPEDLDILFTFQGDAEANRMAAFTAKDPSDREAFNRHWQKIMADETVDARIILLGNEIVGSLGRFEMFGLTQVTYWIGKQFWGRGLATAALQTFLAEYTERPLYGSAAADNARSIRVLEKCGFRPFKTDRGFANARGEEIDEVVLILRE